ncbi:MAG: nuclear transport factor 2 family protein [Myxococcota bacterium]|nr:nuclear transport factor 2 family protein [Myxococcota bacterium]
MKALCQAISLCCALALTTGCAHTNIEGTPVADTSENREVFDFLVQVREAMQNRDAQGLIALISPDYFEDMGTPTDKDDYGYQHLIDVVIPKSLEIAKEIYVSFEVHDIEIDGEQAWADIRYNSRAKLELPSGELWDSHKEFNRIRLNRIDGKWLVTAGL